jgi:hypothetical protein
MRLVDINGSEGLLDEQPSQDRFLVGFALHPTHLSTGFAQGVRMKIAGCTAIVDV